MDILATTAFPEPQETAFPPQARALNGAIFDPNTDVWVFPDAARSNRFNFNKLAGDEALKGSIKRVMFWYVQNRAAGTARNCLFNLRHLLQIEAARNGKPVTQITAESIFRYRGALNDHRKDSRTPLATVISFLNKWHALALPGITEEAIIAANRIHLGRRGGGAEAIRTMDPEQGPFTSIEVDNLYHALEDACARKDMTIENYILASLFLLLGARPVQYASLKICDFVVPPTKGDQEPIYILSVPRAKQRSAPPRHEFHLRLIVERIGKRLIEHTQEVECRFSSILSDPSQAPLFPRKKQVPNGANELAFHSAGEVLAKRCSRIYHRLNVISERTGKPIIVTPRRFRHTLGTRAAEAGCGPLVIADLLDHNTTECVTVYVEATQTIRDRIDRAFALKFATLVGRFRGTVIPGGGEATSKGGDVYSGYIADPRFDPSMRPMANCAHHGPCNLLAPLECYTCPFFRPWVDGPHSRVLEYLLQERDRLHSKHGPRMAANLDSLIFAVARVIQLCNKFKKNPPATTNE